MLTDKMSFVATSIEYIIRHAFPSACLMDVFTEEIEVKDIVTQILFECCKFAYDQTTEKKSLRSHVKSNNLTEDYQRMMIKRSVDKINKYRQSSYETIKYLMGDLAGGRRGICSHPLHCVSDEWQVKLSNVQENECL